MRNIIRCITSNSYKKKPEIYNSKPSEILSFIHFNIKEISNLQLSKLESPLQKMICAKFGWNWHSGSGEGDI